MKYGLIGLVAAAFASKGMSAVLPQAGYEWFIANWTGHFFDVSIPSVAIGDIIIPATKGKCSGGSRREASQCTRDDTAQEDNSILYTVEAYAANHTFMLSYLFHSRERSKSFNVTAYGDAYLSQSWRNSTFKILPSSITEIQTCLNHLAPCPAQSPPAANFWPPDPSEYVFSIVDWNVSQVAYTQDFNITGPDLDYGTGGRSIPSFNAHCKGYGSYEYNEGYVPLRYAQCAVEPRWVTAGYWIRQPPPGSKQLTLGLVVRLSRGDETMWDLSSTVDQAYTRNDETLPTFSANITKASQVAYIDPS